MLLCLRDEGAASAGSDAGLNELFLHGKHASFGTLPQSVMGCMEIAAPQYSTSDLKIDRTGYACMQLNKHLNSCAVYWTTCRAQIVFRRSFLESRRCSQPIEV